MVFPPAEPPLGRHRAEPFALGFRMTRSPRWEHFHHVADIGVRGIGTSKEEAFVQAAIGLTAVVTDPAMVRLESCVDLVAEGAGDDLLLVGWLDAVIYAMATRRMVFGAFDVRFTSAGVEGHGWGEPVDVARHEPVVEVKAATFAELCVRQLPDGEWVAQCVVDV
jgi:tRNA nucleotidyltransferase (CCA-adding enzyme)